MSQLPLPLPEYIGASQPQPAPKLNGTKRSSKADSSSEEEKVEMIAERPSTQPIPMSLSARPMRFAHAGAWPAALTWEDAQVYTSLSNSQLSRFEKKGAIRVRRAGRNGARIVLTSDLDRLLDELFGPKAVGIEEDFDFG